MRTPKVKVSEKLIPVDPYSDYWWGDVKDNLFSNRMITLSLFPLLLTKIYKRLTLPIFKVSINMPTRLDKKFKQADNVSTMSYYTSTLLSGWRVQYCTSDMVNSGTAQQKQPEWSLNERQLLQSLWECQIEAFWEGHVCTSHSQEHEHPHWLVKKGLLMGTV